MNAFPVKLTRRQIDLIEAECRADCDPSDWRLCGFLRNCEDRQDCEMRSGEECCYDATKCKYWHER